MLTEAQFAQYDRDGFLRLGQVATDEELAALQERMDAIMLGRVPYPGMYFQMDTESGVYSDIGKGPKGWQGPSLNYRKIQDLERDPLFLAYMQHPLFRAITRRLIGEDVA